MCVCVYAAHFYMKRGKNSIWNTAVDVVVVNCCLLVTMLGLRVHVECIYVACFFLYSSPLFLHINTLRYITILPYFFVAAFTLNT